MCIHGSPQYCLKSSACDNGCRQTWRKQWRSRHVDVRSMRTWFHFSYTILIRQSCVKDLCSECICCPGPRVWEVVLYFRSLSCSRRFVLCAPWFLKNQHVLFVMFCLGVLSNAGSSYYYVLRTSLVVRSLSFTFERKSERSWAWGRAVSWGFVV